MPVPLKERLVYLWDLTYTLTVKELKVRYKNNFLGYVWSVANPLALALVFFLAFKVFMRIQIENYTVFLIAGLFPWQWFSNSVNVAPMVLIGNASLIKKVGFPREVLVLASVLNDMLHYLLSIPVIVLFLLFYHINPSPTWIVGIPLLLVAQFLLVYGLALMFSSLNLFFRDLERLIFIFTTLFFYCTPIIYSEDMIPDRFAILMKLNLLSPLFVSWRNLFMKGVFSMDILFSMAASAVVFVLGYLVFRRLSWKFAEIL